MQLRVTEGSSTIKDLADTKKINGADYPKQIKAVYWDGKMEKKVLFNR
jgi:hypothetical protein